MGKIVKDFLDMLCDFAGWVNKAISRISELKLKIELPVQHDASNSVIVEKNRDYSYYECEVTHTETNITFQIGVMIKNTNQPLKRELFVSFPDNQTTSNLFSQKSELFNPKIIEKNVNEAWLTVRADLNKDFFDDALPDTGKEDILFQILDAVVQELDKSPPAP
jgi:hypothetical protein